MLQFILLGLLFLVIEYYTFIAICQFTKRRIFRILHLVVSIVFVGYIIYGLSLFDRNSVSNQQPMMAAAMIVLLYLPKAIITVILIVEDLVRLITGIINYFRRVRNTNTDGFIPSRRRFVSNIALGIAALPFLSVLHGITLGRYKFNVYKTIIEFDDLPEAFDGFRFTQLSDLHVGSFDDKEKVEYAVQLINEQETDLLLFTGDIVNSLAAEANPWIEVFQKIRKHPYGNFSILGNHDYGDYAHWDTEEERKGNFEAICNISPQIGFRLLRNENVILEKDGQQLAIVGVENWGVRGHFQKFGDLDKATNGVEAKMFKILMSHDPSHWEAKVLAHPKNFQLTLSGHTHGSQFGIEIPGFIKWSPIQYVYKQWAGLYEEMGKYIYVNRGFGYHAYRGRTGIWPEITVIELRKKK
ncbi:MAG: metallophosphoesterase [Flavobacteriaceae bacterium]|jgi:predicted MPP superfamily phosphohydrolase|nr:metallophosphoesterase [Flavobacteriaceae bacterium]